jgi:dihydrofolate synthase/folylpolyglutamate synthase
MTYDEAIAFWYGRINYEVKAAGPDDLKLERMHELLARLGDPHRRFPSVHITGTKGKGSTAAMLDAILRRAGYRVGLFTSPHLEHVEERVQVDRQSISHSDLARHMATIASVVVDLERTWPTGPTFFEIGTALGFLHFAASTVDMAVVEVGLGGRFDSTNVISPLVSVISSIGLDHMAQLGPTVEAIAFQKAGIIKRGVPVVCGVTEPGPLAVIAEVAKSEAAPMTVIDRDFPIWPKPVGLPGSHQQRNASLAIESVRLLRNHGWPISEPAIRDGLQSVSWPARIEVLSERPTVILDAAHNVPSVEALLPTLPRATGTKTCLFAVSNDKPYRAMLALLATAFDRFVFTKYAVKPRCVPPESLLPFATKPVEVEPNPFVAFDRIHASAKPDDLIVIAGSMFLAGDLRPHLLTRLRPS